MRQFVDACTLWGSRKNSALAEILVDLPIVMPPAVVGIALLETFGRSGLLGRPLEWFGLEVAFATPAVILAQVTVSAPVVPGYPASDNQRAASIA